MEYGLIGERLDYSYSKIIHEKLADYTYELHPLTREEFPIFMEQHAFRGINVTIPYKRDVIPYLDELSDSAKAIGAVNTIVNREGSLTGYNTDYSGFRYMLQYHNVQVEGKKVLILGTGGASAAVKAVFRDLGAAQIFLVSRTGSRTYVSDPSSQITCDSQTIRKPCDNQTASKSCDNQTAGKLCDNQTATREFNEFPVITYEEARLLHADADIIANATPVGTFPRTEDSPLDLTPFTACHTVVDIIYNPGETALLRQAMAVEKQGISGLMMLVAQAKFACELFLGKPVPDKVIAQLTEEIRQYIDNR